MSIQQRRKPRRAVLMCTLLSICESQFTRSRIDIAELFRGNHALDAAPFGRGLRLGRLGGGRGGEVHLLRREPGRGLQPPEGCLYASGCDGQEAQ